ncbi:BnaC05g15500D [Brassica napus]|uniref:BnaC05g15500D protein n=1 Tax=Brassica napus TaxID=3708 RepID=A0A078I4W3_BRANA|nr:BnaC05g15500D [Brassica napus]
MNFVEMENGLVLANKALEFGAKVLDEDVMEEKDKSLDGASGVGEDNNSIENVDQLKKGKKLWEQFVIVDFFVSNVLVSSLSIFGFFFIFSLFIFGLTMLVSSLRKMKYWNKNGYYAYYHRFFPLISVDIVWLIFIGAVSHWCLVFIWNLRGRFGVTWSHCFDINFLVVLVATHGSLAASQFLCLASSTQLQRSSFDITTVMELFFMVAQVDDMVSIKLDVYHSPVVITILSEQMRSTYDVWMVYMVNGKSFRKGNNSVTDLSGRGAERTWCLVYVNWFATDYYSYNALEFDFGDGLYFLIQTFLWKRFSLVWRLRDAKGRGILQIRLRSDGMRHLTMLLLMCLASLSQTQTLLKYTEKTVMGVDYGCMVFQMMLIWSVSDDFVKLEMFGMEWTQQLMQIWSVYFDQGNCMDISQSWSLWKYYVDTNDIS